MQDDNIEGGEIWEGDNGRRRFYVLFTPPYPIRLSSSFLAAPNGPSIWCKCVLEAVLEANAESLPILCPTNQGHVPNCCSPKIWPQYQYG